MTAKLHSFVAGMGQVAEALGRKVRWKRDEELGAIQFGTCNHADGFKIGLSGEETLAWLSTLRCQIRSSAVTDSPPDLPSRLKVAR